MADIKIIRNNEITFNVRPAPKKPSKSSKSSRRSRSISSNPSRASRAKSAVKKFFLRNSKVKK